MNSLPPESFPAHVAIIMDGNGRWAKERGLTRTTGHKEGGEAVIRIVNAALEAGIPWLTLYAFSSENWNRPRLEVEGLMLFLHDFLKKQRAFMIENGIRLHTIGDIERLPQRCQKQLQISKEATQDNTSLNLVLALSYGSRDELTRATKAIAAAVARGELSLENITQKTLSSHLYTAGMPDPDLLIRTSGEMRLSNFLLWQLSYAEIAIISKYWPDFTREDLIAAIEDYSKRHRRFGSL